MRMMHAPVNLDQTAAEIAALLGGRVEGDADLRLQALASPALAGPRDLVPVWTAAASAEVRNCPARCLLVGPDYPPAENGTTLVRVADAEAAIDTLARALGPPRDRPAAGVHPAAVVDPSAILGEGVAIGPFVSVGARARIGDRTALQPGVVVEADAVIGADCHLAPRVVVGFRCVLGDRVLLHAGVVIGADGFGFRRDAQGRHHKIPQVGNVILGDDVEIGANTTVDRARFDHTLVGRGTKLDNDVQVGHNVRLGEDVAIAGGVNLAGHCRLGDRVLMGGMAGCDNGVIVGDDAILGGFSRIKKDVPAGGFVAGIPAKPFEEFRKERANLTRLPALRERVAELERRLGQRDPAEDPS